MSMATKHYLVRHWIPSNMNELECLVKLVNVIHVYVIVRCLVSSSTLWVLLQRGTNKFLELTLLFSELVDGCALVGMQPV
mmetsp:Transcript_5816/g.10528  ORF Transcript_5816/g.10528 Transcript_5816/m.10528 type:complete len:80 (+) Transcript_5816:93-332(+)